MITVIIADIDNNVCYSGAICNIHVCHADKAADVAAAPTRVVFMIIPNRIAGNCAVCKGTFLFITTSCKTDQTADAIPASALFCSFDLAAVIGINNNIFQHSTACDTEDADALRLTADRDILNSISLSVKA